ncbi:hypothetical protein [Vibrio phage 27Ua.3]|nr:hypothetical protein [Vibrio phage 27Ua.3]
MPFPVVSARQLSTHAAIFSPRHKRAAQSYNDKSVYNNSP